MTDGPIKWHGGKFNLAKRIIELFPPRAKNPNAPADNDSGWVHYVEPYFGGGQVLFANDPEGISEVANDLNGRLTNFWRVLAHDEFFGELQRRMEATPFSEREYGRAASHKCWTGHDWQDEQRTMPCVDCAEAFFIHCRQSMSGRMDSFAPLTRNRTRRGMSEQASAWLNSIEGLPSAHARLKRVVILNKPALEVIKQQDGPRTLVYADPPYLHETRVTTGEYEHEMTEADHAALLNVLGDIKGRFILSGYPSGLYEAAELRNGWRHVDFDIANHSSSAKKKKRAIERVWLNF